MRDVPEAERLAFLKTSRDWAGQSIVASRDIPAGTVIEASMLAYKRPGRGGMEPDEAPILLGKKTIRAIPADEQITLADVTKI